MANDPMRILLADHREVEELLDKLADSEEGDEREQMIDELAMKLTAPTDTEVMAPVMTPSPVTSCATPMERTNRDECSRDSTPWATPKEKTQ